MSDLQPGQVWCPRCDGEGILGPAIEDDCPSCGGAGVLAEARTKPVAVCIARCPEHGLHGERIACFVCDGQVEQVEMVPVVAYLALRAALAQIVALEGDDVFAFANRAYDIADRALREGSDG